MVLYLVKWNIHPDKAEAYGEWVRSATQRLLAVPGVVELRAYRPTTGTHQRVATYEFADMDAWAAWISSEEVRQALEEGRPLVTNACMELWGPSPTIPEPIRPGQ